MEGDSPLPPVKSFGKSSLDGRGVWGENGYMNVWLSPFAVCLKPPQHGLLIGYTPIRNKSLKKNKSFVSHFVLNVCLQGLKLMAELRLRQAEFQS